MMQGEARRGETPAGDEMRAFLFVVRRALLLVVRWIEDRYGWGPKGASARRERSNRD